MNLPEKALLGHFGHCPACGYNSNAVIEETVFSCENCKLEMHFSPVTSAAAVIQNHKGNVLFIRRKKEPHKGKLGLPGGFVNPGETLEDALLREVREEVGIDLDSWSYLGGWPNKYSYKSVIYSVTDIYFVAKVKDFKSIKTCPDEVEGAYIANPKTIGLENFAFPSLRMAISEYLNIYDKD